MGLLKDHLLSCSSYSHDFYDTLPPEPDVGYVIEDALAEHYDEMLESRSEATFMANCLMRREIEG